MLVLELAEGGDLHTHIQAATFTPPLPRTSTFPDAKDEGQHLDEEGKLSLGRILSFLGASLVAAAAAAARAGVVWGDAKPENVLLTSAGFPMAADCGAARPYAPGTASPHLFTMEEGAAAVAAASVDEVDGTAEYLPPELALRVLRGRLQAAAASRAAARALRRARREERWEARREKRRGERLEERREARWADKHSEASAEAQGTWRAEAQRAGRSGRGRGKDVELEQDQEPGPELLQQQSQQQQQGQLSEWAALARSLLYGGGSPLHVSNPYLHHASSAPHSARSGPLDAPPLDGAPLGWSGVSPAGDLWSLGCVLVAVAAGGGTLGELPRLNSTFQGCEEGARTQGRAKASGLDFRAGKKGVSVKGTAKGFEEEDKEDAEAAAIAGIFPVSSSSSSSSSSSPSSEDEPDGSRGPAARRRAAAQPVPVGSSAAAAAAAAGTGSGAGAAGVTVGRLSRRSRFTASLASAPPPGALDAAHTRGSGWSRSRSKSRSAGEVAARSRSRARARAHAQAQAHASGVEDGLGGIAEWEQQLSESMKAVKAVIAFSSAVTASRSHPSPALLPVPLLQQRLPQACLSFLSRLLAPDPTARPGVVPLALPPHAALSFDYAAYLSDSAAAGIFSSAAAGQHAVSAVELVELVETAFLARLRRQGARAQAWARARARAQAQARGRAQTQTRVCGQGGEGMGAAAAAGGVAAAGGAGVGDDAAVQEGEEGWRYDGGGDIGVSLPFILPCPCYSPPSPKASPSRTAFPSQQKTEVSHHGEASPEGLAAAAAAAEPSSQKAESGLPCEGARISLALAQACGLPLPQSDSNYPYTQDTTTYTIRTGYGLFFIDYALLARQGKAFFDEFTGPLSSDAMHLARPPAALAAAAAKGPPTAAAAAAAAAAGAGGSGGGGWGRRKQSMLWAPMPTSAGAGGEGGAGAGPPLPAEEVVAFVAAVSAEAAGAAADDAAATVSTAEASTGKSTLRDETEAIATGAVWGWGLQGLQARTLPLDSCPHPPSVSSANDADAASSSLGESMNGDVHALTDADALVWELIVREEDET